MWASDYMHCIWTSDKLLRRCCQILNNLIEKKHKHIFDNLLYSRELLKDLCKQLGPLQLVLEPKFRRKIRLDGYSKLGLM